MGVFLSDVKFAIRDFIKQPGWNLMIVGMLALGIAGTTGIFSIFYGLFLRPLPFAQPERLVYLDEVAPKWNLEFVGIAYPDFHEWRQSNRSFDGMAVWAERSFNLSAPSGVERIEGARVTHDLLSTLGLRPVLGRGFLAEEDKPGAQKVVMLGYGLWQRLFGGRRDVLGQPVRLDTEVYSVVGVLPPEAAFPGRSELWVPLSASVNERQGWYLGGVGRLKDGVAIPRALEDLTRIHRGMIPVRDVNSITSPKMLPFRDRFVGDLRLIGRILLGAVGVVLLIACVNTAGLMLARGAARSREMGIRSALGASRGRIVRQLLAESLLLAALAGLAGTALGYAGVKALVGLMPDQMPRWVMFSLDSRVLLFCIAVTCGSALLFGLWPARDASRVDVQGALQESTTRSSATVGRRRTLSALVTGEIALAVMLLVAAGLLVQAFLKLQKIDPGFRVENVLTYRVSLPDAQYAKPEQRANFFKELLRRHRSQPGVTMAGATSLIPLRGHSGNFYEVENAQPLAKDQQNPVVLVRIATPGYFEAMGIGLRAGRFLEEGDGRVDGKQVIIINETFARRYWTDPSQAIGKRIKHPGKDNPWMTVVGVTRDIKHYGLDREMRPGVYVPFDTRPINSMVVVLRSSIDPASLTSAAREILRSVDPDLPMFQVSTMANRLRESVWLRRTYSSLLAAFAVVALILAIGGIYGVISYIVSQRTREIGIRMALGAQQGQVVRQVLGHGMKLTAAGVIIGLAGAFWTARLLQTLLLGISPRDPVIYAGVALLLAGIAAAANLAPARRAARIDPMTALRFE